MEPKSIQRQRRVLAVEDDEINTAVLTELLDGQPYRLETASSGAEALELLPTYRPDLILLDIMMPGMDGYQVCEGVRAAPVHRHVKVILVSAKAMARERLRGYDAGADDYITKPLDHEELVAKVDVFLRLKSAEEVVEIHRAFGDYLHDHVREPLARIAGWGNQLTQDETLTESEQKEIAVAITQHCRQLQNVLEEIGTMTDLAASEAQPGARPESPLPHPPPADELTVDDDERTAADPVLSDG